MEIIRDNRPPDPVRRRDAQAAASRAGKAEAESARSGGDPVRTADIAGSHPDQATVRKLVDRLKQMEPADVQKIEDLRARIAAGTYTATPEELAEAILGGGRV